MLHTFLGVCVFKSALSDLKVSPNCQNVYNKMLRTGCKKTNLGFIFQNSEPLDEVSDDGPCFLQVTCPTINIWRLNLPTEDQHTVTKCLQILIQTRIKMWNYWQNRGTISNNIIVCFELWYLLKNAKLFNFCLIEKFHYEVCDFDFQVICQHFFRCTTAFYFAFNSQFCNINK